ncbi:MAG: 5-carboxymethyl-2-hydroxymuconate Delta-isomerase [Burkholderiales bacterium]
MPHLTLDYSGNLRAEGDFGALCANLAKALVDFRADGKPVYPVGGVRVRAIAADDWSIGDGRADAAYVHARLTIGAGRGEATMKATGDALFAVMKDHFAALFERRGLALSLEIGEFSESGTWKHNNLHARMRA